MTALISRLAFITEGAIRIRSDAFFQQFNVEFDFFLHFCFTSLPDSFLSLNIVTGLWGKQEILVKMNLQKHFVLPFSYSLAIRSPREHALPAGVTAAKIAQIPDACTENSPFR